MRAPKPAGGRREITHAHAHRDGFSHAKLLANHLLEEDGRMTTQERERPGDGAGESKDVSGKAEVRC